MADVIRRAEEGVRCDAAGVALGLPNEQQHMAATGLVVDVALTGRRIDAGGGLALPVEQPGIDGVIVVHSRGRILLVRLVQRNQQHVGPFVGQPLHTLAQRLGLHEIQREEELVASIGTVHVQRAIIGQVCRRVDEVDGIQLVFQQLDQLAQHDRAVRQRIQPLPDILRRKILNDLLPHGHIEHIEHPLLVLAQGGKVHVVQPRQDVQQEGDPAPGVDGTQPAERLGQHVLHRLGEVFPYAGFGAQSGEAEPGIDRAHIHVVIRQEVLQRQRQAAVLLEGRDAADQPRPEAVALPDVGEDDLRRLLLQLDVAALRHGHEPVAQLLLHAVIGIVQQRGELLLEVILSVGRADEVQHGEAFLPLGQAQAAPQLLEEDRQRFRGPQEQHRVHLGDVHALVVNVHHEQHLQLTPDQLLLGGGAHIVPAVAGQRERRNAAAVKVVGHEPRVFDGHAEAQRPHVAHVSDVFIHAAQDAVGALLRHALAERV